MWFKEYFAVINSAARDIRSFERRTAAVEASYEQLISTGEKLYLQAALLGRGQDSGRRERCLCLRSL